MSVVLYSFEPSAPCRVVRMVAKHIGLPLTIKEVDIAAGDTKKEDFVKVKQGASSAPFLAFKAPVLRYAIGCF